MLTNSPARTPSAMAIAIVSLVRLLCMKIGAESAQPRSMTYRVVVSRFGQSAPVFTTAPSTILGPRIPARRKESPPIADICRLFRKSPRQRDCLVGLGGLEPGDKHAVVSNLSPNGRCCDQMSLD